MSNNFWCKSDGNTDILVKWVCKVALCYNFGKQFHSGTDCRQSFSGNLTRQQEAVTVREPKGMMDILMIQ